MSDMLYIAYLGWFIGLDIKNYRRIHALHHLNHGTSDPDPEDSYSSGLFLAAIPRLIVRRSIIERVVSSSRPIFASNARAAQAILVKSMCLAFHILSLIIRFAISGVYGGLVYFISVFWGCQVVVYLRNCLEHSPGPDGSPISRNFKQGFFSFFFGAAGFCKHGMHHAEPSKNYWQLPPGPNSISYAAALKEVLNANVH